MTAPQQNAGAEQPGDARRLNWVALVLSIVGLGFVVAARIGGGSIPWPMIALPLLLLAQVCFSFGWLRRWPTLHRLFPVLHMVLALIVLAGVLRFYFAR